MTGHRHHSAGWLLFVLAAAGVSPALAQSLSEPFTPSARWSHYLHRTYGPVRMVSLAADTALDQALREPACWDSTAASYGRRFARSFERRIIRNSTELVTGILTGEDLRYRPSKSTTFHGRFWNAVRSSVTAQMPDGTKRPAYTRFFASGVASVATASWTRQPVHTKFVMRSLGWSALDQAQTNLLDEFGPDLRRTGTRLWKRIRPTRP